MYEQEITTSPPPHPLDLLHQNKLMSVGSYSQRERRVLQEVLSLQRGIEIYLRNLARIVLLITVVLYIMLRDEE